jgi:hypothetical protein
MDAPSRESVVPMTLRAVVVSSFVMVAACSGNGPSSVPQPADDAGGADASHDDSPGPSPEASAPEIDGAVSDRQGSSFDAASETAEDAVLVPDAAVTRPDAAPPNDGGITGCRFAFCESFESQAVGSAPDPAVWTRTSPDLLVDATRAAHGGKRSLHVPPLKQGARYIREKVTIPSLGTSFYGRVFFWIDKQPIEIPATLYHWTLLEADELDDFNQGKVLRLGGHIEGDGTNWLRFNFQTHSNLGETGLSDKKAVLSVGRWYCAEFYYSLPDNEARFWLDGVEDPALHWQGPMNGYTFPTTLSWMSFGWAEYQAAATPWEVWIDEIALDKNKTGCD